MSALMRRSAGPEELKYVPQDATVLAYADIQDVMHSQLREHVHHALAGSDNGQRELQDQTGIDIENDIEHVVAFTQPDNSPDRGHGGMVLARGNFDAMKIQNLLRDHGAQEKDYNGVRMFVGSSSDAMNQMHHSPDGTPQIKQMFAVAFVEPRLVALGNVGLVTAAIDRGKNGPNVTSNDDMMKQVKSLEGGNAWAVGRFDQIREQAHLPGNIAGQIPPITWFSINSHVNGGLSGTLRAETRDEESANNLRDVVGGFLALAKMQAGSNPQYQTLAHSLEISVAGNTVSLNFAIPAEIFDALGHDAGSSSGMKKPK
jgi:hypothetical protein